MRRRGLLVVLLLAALAGYFFWRGAQGPGPTLDSQELLTLLADTASQVNARGPVMVDAETRLRGAEAGPGARLTYRYELVAFNRADMDERRFVALKKPELVAASCQRAEVRYLLTQGATLVYLYDDKMGERIADIGLAKGDCP
jgi:hypothetical protein